MDDMTISSFDLPDEAEQVDFVEYLESLTQRIMDAAKNPPPVLPRVILCNNQEEAEWVIEQMGDWAKPLVPIRWSDAQWLFDDSDDEGV